VSAVTILAAASQADSGASAALDVSAFSTLRLNWAARADLGRDPQVTLSVDTAPGSGGPWREISSIEMGAREWQTAPRVTLGGFDAFVRARWSGHPRAPTPRTDVTCSLVLGLAGDGKPEAS
jgi:hypothetical protein